jgi:hypothetical protein
MESMYFLDNTCWIWLRVLVKVKPGGSHTIGGDRRDFFLRKASFEIADNKRNGSNLNLKTAILETPGKSKACIFLTIILPISLFR